MHADATEAAAAQLPWAQEQTGRDGTERHNRSVRAHTHTHTRQKRPQRSSNHETKIELTPLACWPESDHSARQKRTIQKTTEEQRCKRGNLPGLNSKLQTQCHTAASKLQGRNAMLGCCWGKNKQLQERQAQGCALP